MLGNLSGFKEQRPRFRFFLVKLYTIKLNIFLYCYLFVSFRSLICIFLLIFSTVSERTFLNKYWKQLRVTSFTVVISVTHMFPLTLVSWNMFGGRWSILLLSNNLQEKKHFSNVSRAVANFIITQGIQRKKKLVSRQIT